MCLPQFFLLLALVFALVTLQNCDSLTYSVTFVFQGLAERSSASQKCTCNAQAIKFILVDKRLRLLLCTLSASVIPGIIKSLWNKYRSVQELRSTSMLFRYFWFRHHWDKRKKTWILFEARQLILNISLISSGLVKGVFVWLFEWVWFGLIEFGLVCFFRRQTNKLNNW